MVTDWRHTKRFVFGLLAALLSFALVSWSCSPRQDFAAKNKCADRADAYLKHERSIDVPSNGINATVKNEQFTYSRVLDTCLVYFEITELRVGTTYNIVDTLTNKKLFLHVSYFDRQTQSSWDGLCKASDGCLGEDDFRKKHIELFGGNK